MKTMPMPEEGSFINKAFAIPGTTFLITIKNFIMR
jgi:hypothetical protein